MKGSEDKTCALIAWLDVETTGLDAELDEILEVALLLTDVWGEPVSMPGAPHLGDQGVHLHAWLPLSKAGRARVEHNPWVKETHTRSGLLDALATQPTLSCRVVEQRLLGAILQCDVPLSRVHLGGRNPDFERRFLAAHMPRVLEHMSYRHVDITSCETLARETPYQVEHTEELSTHRAVPDVLREVERYRHIKGGLR
jgi:oligoribonuclease